LVIGALISVPFSTIIVKKTPTKILKIAIGVLTLVLGTYTLANLFIF